jgi:hypothetical protein
MWHGQRAALADTDTYRLNISVDVSAQKVGSAFEGPKIVTLVVSVDRMMSSDQTQHISVVGGALCKKVCMQNKRTRHKHPSCIKMNAYDAVTKCDIYEVFIAPP